MTRSGSRRLAVRARLAGLRATHSGARPTDAGEARERAFAGAFRGRLKPHWKPRFRSGLRRPARLYLEPVFAYPGPPRRARAGSFSSLFRGSFSAPRARVTRRGALTAPRGQPARSVWRTAHDLWRVARLPDTPPSRRARRAEKRSQPARVCPPIHVTPHLLQLQRVRLIYVHEKHLRRFAGLESPNFAMLIKTTTDSSLFSNSPRPCA